MKNIHKLIPTKKTVIDKRKGTSFIRTYYIKPNKIFKNNINITHGINLQNFDINFINKNYKKLKEWHNYVISTTKQKFEMAIGLNDNMEKVFEKNGNNKEIYFSNEEINKIFDNVRYLIHNHPTDSPPSVEDILFLNNLSKSIIMIYTNDGMHYLRHNFDFDLNKFNNTRQEIITDIIETPEKYKKYFNNEQINFIKENKKINIVTNNKFEKELADEFGKTLFKKISEKLNWTYGYFKFK